MLHDKNVTAENVGLVQPQHAEQAHSLLLVTLVELWCLFFLLLQMYNPILSHKPLNGIYLLEIHVWNT